MGFQAELVNTLIPEGFAYGDGSHDPDVLRATCFPVWRDNDFTN